MLLGTKGVSKGGEEYIGNNQIEMLSPVSVSVSGCVYPIPTYPHSHAHL